MEKHLCQKVLAHQSAAMELMCEHSDGKTSASVSIRTSECSDGVDVRAQ